MPRVSLAEALRLNGLKKTEERQDAEREFIRIAQDEVAGRGVDADQLIRVCGILGKTDVDFIEAVATQKLRCQFRENIAAAAKAVPELAGIERAIVKLNKEREAAEAKYAAAWSPLNGRRQEIQALQIAAEKARTALGQSCPDQSLFDASTDLFNRLEQARATLRKLTWAAEDDGSDDVKAAEAMEAEDRRQPKKPAPMLSVDQSMVLRRRAAEKKESAAEAVKLIPKFKAEIEKLEREYADVLEKMLNA